ncbi:folliculin isoform X1 [Drosophila willistoni]|uniref:folliculin isoform X1 n=1 Tax=Drosophila willistoni TaxID=7260 RepID=UPI00017D80F8|nr:folliculin isoform X1 [Drosophila willistoni]
MNAVIALCHFCEAHGPCALFCTQTLRDTKIDDLQLEQQQQQQTKLTCSACNSMGRHNFNAIYSTDTESGATFMSTRVPVLPEVFTLVNQAAVLSLSNEIDTNKALPQQQQNQKTTTGQTTTKDKDGEFVFFGDSTRGHILSHKFRVSDLKARGSFQLFSIIVLMKDKYFLLNTKPFLAEHLKKVSSELQAGALRTKEAEEINYSTARQRRLSGQQFLTHSYRSLPELTGEDNIFPQLHSHFAWLLLAGSRFLTEHVTFGNLPWLPPQSSGRPPAQRLTYNSSTLPMIQKYEESIDDPEQEEFFSLRHLKKVLRKEEFAMVCYCALTGIKIIVRGSPERTFRFMVCLKKLLPEAMHNLIRIDAQHQHSISSEYKIISVSNDIAVPIASTGVFRIDFLDRHVNGHEVSVKWPAELPRKLPDLMVKLLKAVEEKIFTELVLNKQTKVLIEEWKNKVICLNHAKSSSVQLKLKKVLGVQPQDQPLINYWSTHLH